MNIIEFLGMPRSGKTTVAKHIFNKSSKIILLEERFDLIPYPQSDLFNYNLWYAKYVVKQLNSISKENNHILIDRGITDRIVFGEALNRYGIFTKNQLNEYRSVLEPFKYSVNLGFVFCLSPEMTLLNRRSNKQNITHDINFLRLLHRLYSQLENNKNASYIQLPEKCGLDNLEEIVSGKMSELRPLGSNLNF